MIKQFKYTDKEKKELLDSMTILIDTREKQSHVKDWLERKLKPYKIKKLDHGDYSFYIPENDKLNIPRDLYFDGLCCVERKASLEELAGNFGKDRARIEKEMATYKGDMQMIIENSQYKDIRDGNYKTKLTKESFINTLHSWYWKWGMSFNFLPDKNDSPLFIYLHFQQFLKNYIK